LPNTAYVKADLDAALLMRGVNYVVSFALAFLTPILILPGSVFALRRKRIAIGLPIAAMAWAFPAYSIVVTGDFMVMGRFLIPGLAFSTILLAWMLNDLWSAGWLRRSATIVAALAVLVAGLLPAWNLHVIPRAARERFRFRFNTDEFKSEFEQWQAQKANTADWTRRGKALKSYVQQRKFPEPNPSYVAGAIGANGYYSDLHIFDKHGLVTPEVARRELEAGRELRSPGHDKRVPKEYFLKDKPTILLATVVQAADPYALVNTCLQQAQALRLEQAQLPALRDYAVDFARVPSEDDTEPRYLLTWTRIAEGADPREAWAELDQRLNAFRTENTLGAPRPAP